MMVFSDLVRARRLFLDTAALGQPAANQSSMTSLNVAKRSRRGPGDSTSARNASISLRSRSASAFSTRSIFRRDPSGNRTPCHPPLLAFVHRTDGRCATVKPSLDVANIARCQHRDGYIQPGYVRVVTQKPPASFVTLTSGYAGGRYRI